MLYTLLRTPNVLEIPTTEAAAPVDVSPLTIFPKQLTVPAVPSPKLTPIIPPDPVNEFITFPFTILPAAPYPCETPYMVLEPPVIFEIVLFVMFSTCVVDVYCLIP